MGLKWKHLGPAYSIVILPEHLVIGGSVEDEEVEGTTSHSVS